MNKGTRDHGGGLDAAIAQYGGARAEWIDLSTGINPVPYPIPDTSLDAWTALPDRAAQDRLIQAARTVWSVPDHMSVLAAPGASALIARLPALWPQGAVDIPSPTYNEHAAAFDNAGWTINPDNANARVLVHPNNPTGHWYEAKDITTPLTIIDESFCDVAPEKTLISSCDKPGRIVLKSFGKFWGLAGMRLGFAIGMPENIAKLTEMIGPWPVSGPALHIGAVALEDTDWAEAARARLTKDTVRLDALMTEAGAQVVGGCQLFRLYDVDDAVAWQAKLAQNCIWSRIFPYSDTWLRLGLPGPDQWDRLEAAF